MIGLSQRIWRWRGGLYLLWGLVALGYFLQHPVNTTDDTRGYLQVAQMPWGSSSFWANAEYPVGAALAMRVFGLDLLWMTFFQLAVSLLAWFALCESLAAHLRDGRSRVAMLVLLAAFSFAPDVFCWHRTVLSESLAHSLEVGVIAIALGLLAPARRLPGSALLTLGLAGALFVLVRDTDGYVLLSWSGLGLLGVGLAALLRKERARGRAPIAAACGIGLLLFGMANTLSGANHRWVYPLTRTFQVRITPRGELRRWFEAQGMPAPPAEWLRANGSFESLEKASDFAESPAVRDWLLAHGKPAFARFLLSHLGWALQDAFNGQSLYIILSNDVWPYTRFTPPELWLRISNRLVFPKGPTFKLMLAGAFLGLVAAAGLAMRRRLEPAQLRLAVFIAILIASVLPLAFLTWHASGAEEARHTVYLKIQLRLAIWMLALLALDWLLGRRTAALGGRSAAER